MKFAFATDSETGHITAENFGDACEQLDAMFTPEIIADGGFGWVQDTDGYRYTIGC